MTVYEYPTYQEDVDRTQSVIARVERVQAMLNKFVDELKDLEGFAEWCGIDRTRRLISIFTEHLAGENVELMSMLQRNRIEFTVIMEGEIAKHDLTLRRHWFMHTRELPHNDLLHTRDYYALFLQTSALKKIP